MDDLDLKNTDNIIGRVIKGVGGQYTVYANGREYIGKPRGIFRKSGTKVLVGDIVEFSEFSEDEIVIEKIIERRNQLVRPVVANVDQVIVSFAIKNPEINYDMLDRIIVLAEESMVDIVLCINKIELATEEELQAFRNIYGKLYKILEVSTFENIGRGSLIDALEGKVTVFAGPSGVGKSSMINMITDISLMETGGISDKIKRGKHTTRHSQFILLEEFEKETFIVDSPGFSSLGLEHIGKTELREYFIEFKNYSNCKFMDCVHVNEPNCEVKENVGKNISEARYNRYKHFYSELKS